MKSGERGGEKPRKTEHLIKRARNLVPELCRPNSVLVQLDWFRVIGREQCEPTNLQRIPHHTNHYIILLIIINKMSSAKYAAIASLASWLNPKSIQAGLGLVAWLVKCFEEFESPGFNL